MSEELGLAILVVAAVIVVLLVNRKHRARPASGATDHVDSANRFSVRFPPGSMTRQKDPMTVIGTADGRTFLVHWGPTPPMTESEVRRALDTVRDNQVDDNGPLVSERTMLQVDGLVGRELVSDKFVERIYITSARTYLIRATGKPGEPVVTAFLDSFRYLAK